MNFRLFTFLSFLLFAVTLNKSKFWRKVRTSIVVFIICKNISKETLKYRSRLLRQVTVSFLNLYSEIVFETSELHSWNISYYVAPISLKIKCHTLVIITIINSQGFGTLVHPFRSHAFRILLSCLPCFFMLFGVQFFIILGNLLYWILFTCCIQFLLFRTKIKFFW